ncbi:MAG: NAD(P)/FAD-dependent oxidoreductase [Planctomycetota bacterium]
MSQTYDAVIVGGGHNGLCCAAYLAKAGMKVLVLERRPVLGGAAVSEEVYPGFTFSVCSYVVSLLRPHIIRELDLPRFGLDILPLDCSFTPLPDGDSLARWGDPERTRREIARFSPNDAEIYPQFGKAMGQMGRVVRPILEMIPPDISSLHPARLLETAKLARLLDRLDEAERVLKLKMFTMSAVDFLDRWFEAEPLRATMAVSGIIGTFQGVRSPGTAYVLLHHYMGEIDGAFRAWGLSRGGTGQVSMAMARAAQHFGAEIRTEAPVERVLIEGGRATGVVLQGSGEEIRTSRVVSCLDPRLTFLGLVGERHLDPQFNLAIRRYKLRGSSGKVNLALDRLPQFPGRSGDAHLRGDIAISPSIDYLERAYDQAKYGQFSQRPYLNVVIPSLTDPTVAPPGQHVLSAFVQYAPYELAEGPQAWPEKRDAFGKAVLDTLEEYFPGLQSSILHCQVLTPWDLEQDFGLSEGNIFHGELSLEQLFFLRPAPMWARHRTPIDGLWMCGSGTHPGGGVMGAPGANAARAMLSSRRSRR